MRLTLLTLLLFTHSSLLADSWILARFELDRFRPLNKGEVKEKALLTWDDQDGRASLVIKDGPRSPLLASVLPEALPHFEKTRRRLEKEDSQVSKLVLKLMAEARGRRLQFIGESAPGNKDRMKVLFGFYPREGSRRLEKYGTVWGSAEKKGRTLVFRPERVEFVSKSAEILWGLIKPRMVSKIEMKIARAKKQ